jgi:hypothetical protein
MDEDKPPVRRLVLRPKEIIPTEERSLPGDGSAISVSLMHRQNEIAEAKAVGMPSGEQAPPAARDEAAIRVHDILRQNLIAAADPRSELIAMPARRTSRRNRDFMLVLGVALAAAGALSFVFREDRRVIALALVGVVVLTLVLAWILYGVMEKY